MKLETPRLRLIVATQAQMEQLIATQTDEELRLAYEEMLAGALAHPEQWLWYAAWIIADRDGTMLGDLCFKGLAPSGAVEIGYGLLEEQQGRGYATEAVEAAVRWALAQPGVLCVEAETDPENRASQRVLEKCGFVPTGTVGKEGPRFVRRR